MTATTRKHRSVLDYGTEEDLREALQSLSVTDGSSKHDGATMERLPDWQVPCLPNTIEQEVARLRDLQSYQILDTEREGSFDLLTEELRKTFNVSWACVSLVDLGRQWFKSLAGKGLEDVHETARHDAFCARTILQCRKGEFFVVEDALQDHRFCNTGLVTGRPHLRFYAGTPLVSEEGQKLGTLCLFDNKPRPTGLTQSEQEQLRETAGSAMKLLSEHRDRLQTMRKRPSSNYLSDMSSEECLVPVADGSSSRTKRNECSENSGKRSRANSPERRSLTDIIANEPAVAAPVPVPNTCSHLDPDEYLQQLVEAMCGVKLKVKPGLELQDFWCPVTEEQITRYSVEVVTMTRSNDVVALRQLYQEKGRDALDCFNRFGEGLLNMACRRGFKEIAHFLLSPEVALDVRVRDDYGRTPMHDACWNPEPQLEICERLMSLEPSLFLVADKRGFTPFQYARKSDWHIWRQFLFDNREHLVALKNSEILDKFS